MRTSRPTAASKPPSSSAVRASPWMKLTLRSPSDCARPRATLSAAPSTSTPTTSPSGPTSSAASKATSPAPLPTSRTRMPGSRPAGAEEPLGRGFEDGRLVAQALVFLPRARQRVARVVLRTRRAAAGLGGMTHDLRMNHSSGTCIWASPLQFSDSLPRTHPATDAPGQGVQLLPSADGCRMPDQLLQVLASWLPRVWRLLQFCWRHLRREPAVGGRDAISRYPGHKWVMPEMPAIAKALATSPPYRLIALRIRAALGLAGGSPPERA